MARVPSTFIGGRVAASRKQLKTNASPAKPIAWYSRCLWYGGGPARWSRERQRDLPQANAGPLIFAQSQSLLTDERCLAGGSELRFDTGSRCGHETRLHWTRGEIHDAKSSHRGRVIAAFAAVALFTFGHDALAADVSAVLLTIAAIALDGLDGYSRANCNWPHLSAHSSTFW